MSRTGWSYDETRDTPHPCRCGLLVTRPDYCEREHRCLFRKIASWAPDIFRRGQPDSSEGCE